MTASWKRPTAWVAAIALVAWIGLACGEGEQAAGEEGEAEEVAEANESGGTSCLAEYEDRECEVLTEEMVRSHFPDAPAEMNKSEMVGCTYAWPSEVESRRYNQLVLGPITQYSSDPRVRFRTAYLRAPKDQEGDDAKLEDRAEEEGLDETVQETGEKIIQDAAGSARYGLLEGVGDMASYGGYGGGNTLYVLDGDTKFEVRADVSADKSENRETAIEIARAVMEVCE